MSKYESQYFLIGVKHSTLRRVSSNIELYNLLVPYSLTQKKAFNIYIHLDCREGLTLSRVSEAITTQYLHILHIKPKPPPDYPFGSLPQNVTKFKQWTNKFKQKCIEPNKDTNIVLVLDGIEALIPKEEHNHVMQEQQKEH